mgnify:CR=1 FL=1|jgi:urea carboxylase
MFTKVLIANRGAIAVRICRTLKAESITSLVIYAENDRDSLHVKHADQAVSLGSGDLSQTYLNSEKIIAIALEQEAQAIHPGYGFLSENPEFVESCEAAGLVFLGPTAEQMRLFGLKHTARELAEKAQVPLLPGSGIVENLDEALISAETIGYPLMLKSTAGGGGIGMSLCHSANDLSAAFDKTRQLSQNNFSSGDMFLEKFVAKARHIEVQVFGDGKGKALTLGERDCSAQRRNQKVIEEAPAPNLDKNTRVEIQQVSERLMCSINYRSAGTVEFIYDVLEEAFYFLEVNTRLQVEHGVTEEVYGVDIVKWMLDLGQERLEQLEQLKSELSPSGHSIQVRLYAENPSKDFQPSTGLLTQVEFPDADFLRVDHWIEPGMEISASYDPMLAKLIVTGEHRAQAVENLSQALKQTRLYGFETNLNYLEQLSRNPDFIQGRLTTSSLAHIAFNSPYIEVLDGGTQTTVQDYPGRSGYWQVGIPPSGPFDDFSFRLGNRLLGNTEGAAGLECTLRGPSLRFYRDCRVLLAGADMQAKLEGEPVGLWTAMEIKAGQQLTLGQVQDQGCRTYLLVEGGLDCPSYLDSQSTFTLGQFGGHCGRALHAGDFLHLSDEIDLVDTKSQTITQTPELTDSWKIRVIAGPQGAPEFFTQEDIEKIFSNSWEVHFNSSRTGVRLIGPKPDWARSDGGEAGLHPSNIHDNAYALGSIDFTGDMPVILGPDGPSLGGFVCPATVISADRWKLGQLKAGDQIQFVPVSLESARDIEAQQTSLIAGEAIADPLNCFDPVRLDEPSYILYASEQHPTGICCRIAGDKNLLVEYGDQVLDIRLRCRVQALYEDLLKIDSAAILEMTPGIRSLQIHYCDARMDHNQLLNLVLETDRNLGQLDDFECESRIIHLPLSWDDEVCKLAAEKYMQTVRKDAPWCPSNIEFIRRINGLDSVEDVYRLVFAANYLVLGLGDVYLGAPVATPINPKHRLVTTKYNPARTWTAENSVGIGGSYMCIYGMEGPGGYQLFGRTLQMWNRYRKTSSFSEPWLLRFFDQIRFYPVSHEELEQIRYQFPRGEFEPKIESSRFSLKEYQSLLDQQNSEIDKFTQTRQQAFEEELKDWENSGLINFESEIEVVDLADEDIPMDSRAVYSSVAGAVWKLACALGDSIQSGDTLFIAESMKMEIEVQSNVSGTVSKLLVEPGQQIKPGQMVALVKTDDS